MKPWPVLCVFALAAAACAADAPVSELAPPGTKVAIGINVRGLLDSSLAKDLAGADLGIAAILAPTQKLAGFDPLRDVDRVLILVTNGGSQAQVLGVLSGRFDVEQLAHGAKQYRDVPVIHDEKSPNIAIGLIDGQTAIVGDLVQVEAAIDRRGSGAHLDANLVPRIDAAWSKYDFWGVGDCPEGLAATGPAAEPFNAFDRFSFGATLRQGLELTVEVHPRTTADGTKMALAMSMIEAAIQKQQPQDSKARFDVHSENGALRISVTVPEAELRKGLQAQRATLASSVSMGLQGVGPITAQMLEALASAPQSTVAFRPPVRIAPPPKPAAKAQIVSAPDGDTMYLRLPGAK